MLELRTIHKSYAPGAPVLVDIDLHVEAGAIVCLLGPSGCGKTTLLRIVAGLETPDGGTVRFAGRDLVQVPVYQRQFGLMFQDFALFPHLSVGQNVAFGLRMAGQSAQQIRRRVAEMLDLVNMPGYGERSIFELSGGERQRVALARSLAPNPRLLMLDEPLGSLDRTLREELMVELRAILKDVGVTALYVTHDQEEAFAVADRIVLMNRGRIEQDGPPQAVYACPATVFVARFLGFSNLLPATVGMDAPDVAQTPLGDVALASPAQPGAYTLLIRPDAITVVAPEIESENRAYTVLHGVVSTCSFRGEYYQMDVTIDAASGPVMLRFNTPVSTRRERTKEQPAQWQAGKPLTLRLDPTRVTLLPPEE